MHGILTLALTLSMPAAKPAKGPISIEAATAGLKGSGQLMARIETSMGVMEAKLFENKTPRTVANFVGLARGKQPFQDPKTGKWVQRPYYDGLIFHRVIKRFMIQGGCPLGTGTGNPGYEFGDEFYPTLKHNKGGLLSMANSGPGTNGSQFFVTEVPTPHLDNRHTIFGELTEGMKVQYDIARVPAGRGNRPLEPVTIKKVTIYRAKKK